MGASAEDDNVYALTKTRRRRMPNYI